MGHLDLALRKVVNDSDVLVRPRGDEAQDVARAIERRNAHVGRDLVRDVRRAGVVRGGGGIGAVLKGDVGRDRGWLLVEWATRC